LFHDSISLQRHPTKGGRRGFHSDLFRRIYDFIRELAKEFFSLQNELCIHFEAHKESIEEPIIFDVGFVCAVNCDGRWYRTEVTDMKSYPEIGAILLDKCCPRTVNATEIRRLPDGLDQAASTFICASFSRIHPQPGTDDGLLLLLQSNLSFC